MNLRKTHNYRMDFESKQHFAVATLMGGAFFLRAVYYFGFTRPENVGVWNLLIFLILPMLLEAGYMVLLRGIRFNAPGVYGMMGAGYCLLLMLQSFQSGGVLRIILAVLAYLACAVSILAVTAGLLSKGVAVALLLLTLGGRFLIFDLSGYVFSFRIVAFIREAAALCGISSLYCLCAGLKERMTKK